MLMMILASMLVSEPSAARSDNGFGKVQAARIASQDVQQVAIDTITGGSPTSSSSGTPVAERSGTADPQSEIVDRITGRNLQYPRTTEKSATGVDLQSAIVRSIIGRK